jgi:hypothetical protein
MSREAYFLVAGFDFGTSFTKVVIQSHGRDKGVAHAVQVEGQHLLPAVIGIDDDKAYGSYGRPLPAAVAYLKVLAREVLHRQHDGRTDVEIPAHVQSLFQRYGEKETLEVMLLWYFANVIAAAREYIKTSTDWRDFDFKGEYHKDFLTWQLCVPTGYKSDHQTDAMMLRALKFGYLLAPRLDGSMKQFAKVDNLYRFRHTSDTPEQLQELQDYCYTYPEVAAAVQTVMRAPTAKDGLYLTVDVGAGTVDMNLFRRNTAQHIREPTPEQRGTNEQNYYATDMSFLGAARIQERREINPFSSLNIDLPNQHAHWGLAPMPEADIMKEVEGRIWDLYHRALQFQPNLGDVKGGRTYDRITVYAWGGGFGYQPYRTHILHKLNELMKPERELLRLPGPPNLQLPVTAAFDRMAIAYGLSFDRTNLEEVGLPLDLRPWKDRQPKKEKRQDGDRSRDFPPDFWTNNQYDL